MSSSSVTIIIDSAQAMHNFMIGAAIFGTPIAIWIAYHAIYVPLAEFDYYLQQQAKRGILFVWIKAKKLFWG